MDTAQRAPRRGGADEDRRVRGIEWRAGEAETRAWLCVHVHAHVHAHAHVTCHVHVTCACFVTCACACVCADACGV